MGSDMKRVTAYSGEDGILISSTSDELMDYLQNDRFNARSIPSYSLREGKHVTEPEMVFVEEEQAEGEFSNDPRKVSLKGRFGRDLPGPQLTYLLLHLFEPSHQERGDYTLHASAIQKNGKSLLLLGRSGSGKTISALSAINDGFEVICDDRVVVSDSPGIPIHGYNSYLGFDPSVFEKMGEFEFTIPEYRGKRLFRHEELGLKRPRPVGNVSGIFYVNMSRVDNAYELDPVSATVSLYADLSELIRCHGSFLVNYDLTLPSLDSQELASRRSRFAKRIAHEIPVFDVYGDPSYIGERANDIIQSSA